MSDSTETCTETRVARAWYVMYPLNAYALGPMRFTDNVSAEKAVEEAEELFGERPSSVWPEGPTEEVDEYEYELKGEGD